MPLVPPGLVLSVNVLAGVSLLAFGTSYRLARVLSRGSAALAALPLLTAGVLVVYVFGEDGYRGNGTSRWDAYRSSGGALSSMFVLSVSLMAVCATLLVHAGLRNRARELGVTAFAGGLTADGTALARWNLGAS